ncbi:MAG: helix-turn-helix domain-containing protein [Alphaproteobacteria bacterium]|nr:helix-turn-helix domain-containing protein [Alphaproteobacteria bacterium]
MPLQLLDEPERLILLSDQLHLLECAARDIGDAAFPARLATTGGILALGRYGQTVCSASRLRRAIDLADESIGPLLQTETKVKLRIHDGLAQWTYAVTDASNIGRQKNEILALGYMLDLLRRFLGPRWTPVLATVSGSSLPARAVTESVLNCDLSLGAAASVQFPSALLDATNPTEAKPGSAMPDSHMPERPDLALCTEHLIDLGLLDGRPSIAWLCRHLGISRRSFQRRLQQDGLAFEALLQRTLARKAQHLLSRRAMTLAEIAQTLGYSDQAHFSRAFKSWTGMSPRAWQAMNARQAPDLI